MNREIILDVGKVKNISEIREQINLLKMNDIGISTVKIDINIYKAIFGNVCISKSCQLFGYYCEFYGEEDE